MVRTDLTVFPLAADVSSTYFKNFSDRKLATPYRISLAYSHTVFQYAMIDVALRKRPFFAEILFRLSGVEPCLESVVSRVENFHFWCA